MNPSSISHISHTSVCSEGTTPPTTPFAAVLAAAFALGLAGCHEPLSENTPPPAAFERQGNLIVIPEQSALRSRLQCEPAFAEKIRRAFSVPASVEADPRKFARIFPPLPGRLSQLHAQLGEEVAQGQLLASLDSPDFLEARNDYAKARSAAALAARALRRQQGLLENKIAAQKDVEQAEGEAAAAQGDLDNATGRLLALGFDPRTDDKPGEKLRVVSPIAGRVVELAAAGGEFRNDPAEPLMSIADLSTVWLAAEVPEMDLRFISPGQEITAVFAAYPDEPVAGTVLFVGDMIDLETRAARVRVALANPQNRFKPGMFATVSFLGFAETRVSVPASAVVQSGESSFVFVEVRPRVFEARQVRLGQQARDRIVIIQGLRAGESVLSREGVLFL